MWFKILLAVNAVALIGFLIAAGIVPLFTDLDVRMRFTQLDRAGVINNDALDQFDPSYKFQEGAGYRATVPRFLAGTSLQRERMNAICGAIASAINCACAGFAWWSGRRVKPTVPSREALNNAPQST
jgi:hypothetical protein